MIDCIVKASEWYVSEFYGPHSVQAKGFKAFAQSAMAIAAI